MFRISWRSYFFCNKSGKCQNWRIKDTKKSTFHVNKQFSELFQTLTSKSKLKFGSPLVRMWNVWVWGGKNKNEDNKYIKTIFCMLFFHVFSSSHSPFEIHIFLLFLNISETILTKSFGNIKMSIYCLTFCVD